MIESQQDFVLAWVGKAFSRHHLPMHMWEGLKLWLLGGVKPGDFLWFILTNDFAHAAGQADAVNQACLYGWARLLVEAMPVDAWGSTEKCRAWRELCGLEGIAHKAASEPA